jgi:hypothetical protein
MLLTQDQRRQLVVNHERYIEEVTRDLEQRLQADRDARIREEKEKKDIGRELAETEAQLEDDVDTEVGETERDGTGGGGEGFTCTFICMMLISAQLNQCLS